MVAMQKSLHTITKKIMRVVVIKNNSVHSKTCQEHHGDTDAYFF